MVVSPSSSANAAPIQVECRVGGDLSGLAADFPAAFCDALVSALSRQLNAAFSARPRSGWTGDGRAVVVRVSVRSPQAAGVAVETGLVAGGSFRADDRRNSDLSARDRPLGAFSATTMVRPIGLQLGLIR